MCRSIAQFQEEECLRISTPATQRYRPGDEIHAIPTYVCPAVVLRRQAYVIENGQFSGTWEIAARDRVLSI